jgi:DNA polymerase III delta prime subunit
LPRAGNHSGRKPPLQSESKGPRVGTFAQQGEVWTLGLDGNLFALKDVKGLSYIQRLLRHPGQEFHALDILREPQATEGLGDADKADLIASGTVSVGGAGDSGEMLDSRAKEDYRRRLRDLAEDLEEQRALGNEERAEGIEAERDSIIRELSRAVGLGGRDRRAGSATERARLNVTRAIKTALLKISEHDRSMSEALERRIRTGIFARYAIDPAAPIEWRFSLSIELEHHAAPKSPPPQIQSQVADLLGYLDEQTKFVGRFAERSALRRVLEQVRAGSGRVAMIAGTPGVGKTRTASEFAREAAQAGFLALTGACYDRDDAVPYIPFVEMFESALTQASDPQAARELLGDQAPEIARLMPQLRRIFPEIPDPPELPPEQTQRALLSAAVQVFARLAAARPLLLLVDDLHWADEGTLSLLNHLARSFARLRVMVIGTYRDNELDLSGLLARTLDEFTRLHILSRINLGGLSEDAVGGMIEALCGREAPPELVKLIFSGTEGNPFFVEELSRHLMDRGKLFDANGEFRRDLTADDLDVPQSLRLVIGRRLANLSPATQGMLAAAAVIGPSFAFELLEATTGIDADKLLDQVEEAESAGLLSGGAQPADPRFRFSHELVRQALLANLSVPRLQRLHLEIATALERLHASQVEEQANDISYHLWQAGGAARDTARTIRYLNLAARRAIAQGAYGSAVRQLRNALELIRNSAPSEDRDRTELDLLIDCGVCLLVLRGWSDPEMGEVYARARELCKRVGDTERLLPVLFGLSSFHINRAELCRARTYAEEMNSLASVAVDDKMLMSGWSMGLAQFFQGEFEGAHERLLQGVRFYDRQKHKGGIAFRVGQDLGASCMVFDAMTLLIMGFPDQAEMRLAEAIALARDLRYPFTLVAVLAMAAKYFCIRRDFGRLPEVVQETRALAREHGFAFYEEGMLAYENIGLAAQGKAEELRKSFMRTNRSSEIRFASALTWSRSALAEGLGRMGRTDRAARLLDGAVEQMKQTDERYVEAEIHRIGGELELMKWSGAACSPQELRRARERAEHSFRLAMESARRGHAKLFELRAANSLGRLLSASGRNDEARRIVAETYGAFTEGFDAPDLVDAKAFLEMTAQASR